jgi:hypothetical protein
VGGGGWHGPLTSSCAAPRLSEIVERCSAPGSGATAVRPMRKQSRAVCRRMVAMEFEEEEGEAGAEGEGEEGWPGSEAEWVTEEEGGL